MRIESQAGQTVARVALPKVSVVDDDPDLLTFFEDLAQSGRFVLRGAYSSAGEALVHLPQCPPDVLFMDLRLPDISGIECTKRLTTILPGLPIILITGYPEQSVLIQALRAGASGYMIKPCTSDETLAAINELLKEGVTLSKSALPYLRELIRQLRHHDPSWNLTEREEQLIALIFERKAYKEIASSLGIGPATIHTHMNTLFAKLGVHSQHEVIAKFLHP
jgi:DNA-binding NarL/FixJ family response regulator